MLYVGTGMKDPEGTPEPSLINPLCPVQPTYGCYSTRTLDYWPNYSAIDPETRGAYLGWLASGRSHPKADIGFVFMYFYGLERRAFIDSYSSSQAQEEWPLLIEEVRRLLGIYGAAHRPFAERASRFIEMLLTAKTAKNLVIGQGKYSKSVGDMSLELKKELGQLALTKQPLLAQAALAWAESDPGLKRGTTISRFPGSFKKLFTALYNEAYPQGLLILVTRTKLMMQYEPASQSVAGFGQLGIYLDDIPDVTLEGGVSGKLQTLLDACNEAMAAYGRFVSRNPGQAQDVEALTLLPEVLWPEKLLQGRDDWRSRVMEGPQLTSPSEIVRSFGAAEATSKSLLSSLALLSSAHIGLEPELGGKLPKLDEPVVLFALEAEEGTTPASAAYIAARVTLQLAHFVAAAEGPPTPEILDFVDSLAASWIHLSRPQRARLAAYSRYLRAVPAPLTTIKKNATAIEPLARGALATVLCRVAQYRKDASPAVVKVMAKLYKLLELDPARLHSDLHAAAAGKVSLPAASVGTQELDVARIAALQQDTAVVSALLADIFVDEDEPATSAGHEKIVTLPADVAQASPGRVMGLDEPHSRFALVLRSRSSWMRSELEEHAQGFGLMLDGALEQINEAAFDTFDMPLVEGEDPYEINPELSEALT